MRLILPFLLISSTLALPDGAPSSACSSLTPIHGSGILAQSGGSPYTVITKLQNDIVQVSVGSLLQVKFQGFILQGRNPEGEIVGSFQIPGGTAAHTLDCKEAADTVTHNSPDFKDYLDFMWIPPADYEGTVTFNSTVAQDYATFWVGVTSQPIRIRKRSAPTDSFYTDCGVTKYCFGSPIDCVGSGNCKVAVAITSVGDAFDFEMKAKKYAAWIGVGLSDDAKMGDDSVVECVLENGQINAYMSWTSSNPYKATRLNNPKEGIQLLNGSVDGEELYCKVRRDTVTNIHGNIFNLKKNSFHVLVAAGAEANSSSVGFHDISFLASANPQVLSPISQTLFNDGYQPVTNQSNFNTRTETATPPYFSPTVAKVASTEFDAFYEGCGNFRLCFGLPADCVKSKNCKAVAAITVNGDKYDFEVKAGGNAAWVGVGLSDDKKMGDDSVIECVKSGNDIKAYMSWTGRDPYRATRLENPQLGIELLNSSMIDDTIYCKVRRNTETTVNGKTFNLAKDKYYILIAAGPRATSTGVSYHELGALPSETSQALSDTSEVKAASKLLIYLHGSFMVVSWIGTASVGILLARYYRNSWVGSSMMGKDLWFAWHRIFMVLTWLLTLAAFVLIFVELKEWSQDTSNPHAILGTITTALCFLQPIMAYFRPHPGTSKRTLFNWAHWLVGNSAHILAIITLFFAVKLTKAELPDEVDYILAVYVVVHVVIHLLLSLLNCISEKSSDSRVSSFPMKDLGGSGRNSLYSERNLDARFSGCRKAILGIYIVILIILVVGLVTIITLSPINTWPFKKSS